MFKLLTISDIIDKHKNKPAIIECHGPSANDNRGKINKLCSEDKLVIFAINEWPEFKNRMKPHYWVRSNPSKPNLENDFDYFNKNSDDDMALLSCDVVDPASLKFVEEHLKFPYLPFDTRHFNGKTCRENYDLYGDNYLPGSGYFTFFPDCCNRRGRLTLQEELQKYTKYHTLYSPSPFTASICMITFAVLMGCNPVYINGMDLDYHTDKGTYADLNKDSSLNTWSPPSITWSDWRAAWMSRDLNIVNESAKNIGTKILNLNHDTWYSIFEDGNL